jgi:hypothetical protein
MKRIDSCESLFLKFYELAVQHGTSHQVHQASLGLVHIRFIKQQLGFMQNSSNILESWASYYGKALETEILPI